MLGEAIVTLTFTRISVGRHEYPCFLFIFSFYVPIPMVFFPLLWRSTTYIAVCMISRIKGLGVEAENKLKIIKAVVSFKAALLVVTIMIIVHAVVYGSVLLYMHYGNKTDLMGRCSYGILNTVLIIVQAVCYVLPCSLALLYMFINKNTKDRFFIKIELLLSMIILSATIALLVIFGQIRDTSEALIIADLYVTYAYVIIPGIIANDVLCVWIPILLSFQRNNSHKEAAISTLELIMKDQNLKEAFKSFLIESFVPELVFFYEDCKSYDKIESSHVRFHVALHMYKRYLEKNSPMELNINTSVIRSVRRVLRKYKTPSMDPTTPAVGTPTAIDLAFAVEMEETEIERPDLVGLFKEAKMLCEFDLTTHVNRFMDTKEYKVKKDEVKLEEAAGIV
ncbi:RGS13 [Acrasis kona]|uniref:RGS13 n=1 Tax=Acrasis kona TaxID=1008807 RepID=A0AAW2ZLT3_9EUKA